MRTWIRWVIVFFCLTLLTINLLDPAALTFLQRLHFDALSIVLLAIIFFAMAHPYLRSVLEYLERIHKRWVIISICLILIVFRIALPSLQIDANTIWLIAITALLFILPDLKSLMPYIKRIRIGDTELELKESIDSLEKEVEKAQEAVSRETEDVSTTTASVSSDIEKVLEESGKDPRSALLLLSAKIEEQLRSRLEEAGVTNLRPYPLTRYVDLGVQKGIFPKEFLSAFRDFWAVRNRVAHGAAFDVEDSYIMSLISLGTQLLKITSTSIKLDEQVDNSDKAE